MAKVFWVEKRIDVLSFFSIPVVAMVNFIVSRIGPKRSPWNGKGTEGPIRNTLQSTLAANGIEKRKRLG